MIKPEDDQEFFEWITALHPRLLSNNRPSARSRRNDFFLAFNAGRQARQDRAEKLYRKVLLDHEPVPGEETVRVSSLWLKHVFNAATEYDK